MTIEGLQVEGSKASMQSKGKFSTAGFGVHVDGAISRCDI